MERGPEWAYLVKQRFIIGYLWNSQQTGNFLNREILIASVFAFDHLRTVQLELEPGACWVELHRYFKRGICLILQGWTNRYYLFVDPSALEQQSHYQLWLADCFRLFVSRILASVLIRLPSNRASLHIGSHRTGAVQQSDLQRSAVFGRFLEGVDWRGELFWNI